MSAGGGKPVPACHASRGVVLRPLAADRLALTLAWRNRDGVRQRFLHSDVITPEGHRSWFERYLGKTNDVVLLASLPESAEPFGQVAIYDIDASAGEAEVGRFVVAPGQQGRGLMRQAIAALADLARDELHLKALRLEVREDNERAIRLYESLGYRESGRREGVLEMRLRLDA